MRTVVLGTIVCSLMLVSTSGCGSSRSQEANNEVERLTYQAEKLFESNQLDEAQNTINQALAIKDATDRQAAIVMAKTINAEQKRRDTEQFDREATKILIQALALAETDGPEAALTSVAKSLSDRYWPKPQPSQPEPCDTQKDQDSKTVQPPAPQASATHRKLAHKLLQQVQNATSSSNGRQYWKPFKLEDLIDFREKGRLPKGWESVVVKDSPHADTLRRFWAITLHQTLAEALATAEIEADRKVDPDYLLPSPTIEEVAADPQAWQGKEVQFDNVWIDGEVRVSKRHGFLLTVISPAGEVYKPIIESDAFIFTTRATVSKRLELFVSPDERVKARIFCKIIRGRKIGAAHVSSFHQAVVFKVELYAKPDEE